VIALTTTQNLLISEVDEVPAAVPGEPDCKLVNPFVINTESGQTILEPWLLDITRDDIFMLSSDKILTLCDPTPTLLEKYQDITK
tara:strand:- start:205 stop:459 length:255 start_codon:yes stop_codon:yes gene_type:complete